MLASISITPDLASNIVTERIYIINNTRQKCVLEICDEKKMLAKLGVSEIDADIW